MAADTPREPLTADDMPAFWRAVHALRMDDNRSNRAVGKAARCSHVVVARARDALRAELTPGEWAEATKPRPDTLRRGCHCVRPIPGRAYFGCRVCEACAQLINEAA